MSAILEHPRRDKALLLERSALCRNELQREIGVLRDALRWPRVAAATLASPPARRIALGLAISLVGSGRIAKLVALAGRVFLVAQLARGLLRLAHARSRSGAADSASGSSPAATGHRAVLAPDSGPAPARTAGPTGG